MRYFNEIVGLRIYLALWVAIAHAFQLAGYLQNQNAFLRLVGSGHDAVTLFIIVSGFVITNLVVTKPETYLRYITRRFFRLYPAYVLACVLGFSLADDWAQIVAHVPWQNLDGWAAYSLSITQLADQAISNFAPHFALHAIMLHGLVPTQILDHAAQTFLPAAWSISLEWQFYLVAPLVLLMVRRPVPLAILAFTALAVLTAHRRGWLGDYDIGASLAGATPYFAIGIASRLAYERLASITISPLAAAAVVLFVALAFTREPLPVALWGLFLSFSLWSSPDTLLGRAFRLAFTARPVLLLGEASYSLYLVHRPVQVIFGLIALATLPLTRDLMLVAQLAAVVAAIPLAIAMYFWIERPGIALGRALASRLPAAIGARTPAVA